MNNRRWLDIAEYLSFFGSGVGSIASAVSGQVIYASAPLSCCILLNLLNRRRLNQQTETRFITNLNQLDQRLAQESKFVQALRRRVLALPTPDDFGQLKAALEHEHQVLFRLSRNVTNLQAQINEQLAPLNEFDLNLVHEEIAHLKQQYGRVQIQIADLNHQLEGAFNHERVDLMETSLQEVLATVTQLQQELQHLADQPHADLLPLQTQVELLEQRLSHLSTPAMMRGFEQKVDMLGQELEKVLQRSSNLVPRNELSNVFSELERLHQWQKTLGQTMAPLKVTVNELKAQVDALSETLAVNIGTDPQAELTELRGYIETLIRQMRAKFEPQINQLRETLEKIVEQFVNRPEPYLIDELRRSLAKVSRDVSVIQTQMNDLPDISHLSDLQDELQAVVNQQIQTLQQQVSQAQALEPHLILGNLNQFSENLEALQEQVAQMQQVTQFLDQQQQFLQEQFYQPPQSADSFLSASDFNSTPRSEPSEVPAQIANLTAKLQELETWLSQGGKPAETDSSDPSATGTSTAQSASAPNQEYKLMVDRPDSRAILEEMLGKAEQRLIIASLWLEQCGLDDQLLHQLMTLLQRNIEIHIGWSPDRNLDRVHLPRRIHAQWDESPHSLASRQILQSLQQLSQIYPERLHLKALSTEEKLLVCDRSFAILLRRNGSPVEAEETEAPEVGLCTTDPEVIQCLIESFDHPILNANDVTSYLRRGATRHELGDWQGAIADYTHVLQLQPQDEVTHNNRGIAYYSLGMRQAAIEDFEQAIEINPLGAFAYSNRGIVRAELGDIQGAIEDYTHAIELDPLDEAAYNNRGLLYSRIGERHLALQDYTEALQLNPQDEVAYTNRGLVRSRLGDKQGAIADYTEALQLKPNDEITYFNRGAVRASLGDHEGAIEDYTEAIRLNPRFANAYNNRGFVRQKLGDRQGAIADFDQAIEIDPNFANAYNNRGTTRSKLRDYWGAIEDFNHALEINPNFANAYNNRGTARSKLKDYERAIEDFDQAIRINPDFANAYNNRGLARADAGYLTGATEDLMKAARLFCNQGDEASSQQALTALKRLQQLSAAS